MKVLSYKRDLNLIPEVGWNELKTTQYIQSIIPMKPFKIGFGGKKVGLLYKVGDGKNSILLRADIDALRSQEGSKHLCGHSSHMAGLMAAFADKYKEILKQKDKSVYFLFQPAEETYPSGAKAFLDECYSILPQIKYAFASHVRPKLPLDTISIPNIVVGRGDYMEFLIQGKMVHIKNALWGIDALEAGAEIIIFIKKLQKRFGKQLRIAIGVASGGLQPNAIAGEAILKGDIRMKNNKYQSIVKNLIRKEIGKIQQRTKAKINFKYFDGYPPLINNKKLAESVSYFLKKNSQFKINLDNGLFTFGSEDFSFISDKIPSIYALIGTGDLCDIHEENCAISDKGTINIYKYFMQIIYWWLRE